ncbi:hypothetical protein LTR85_002644 [Meristemomyces frigidus]|nr:hypothetical protein LTR85_002644 [Meristemomyces frigidus]
MAPSAVVPEGVEAIDKEAIVGRNPHPDFGAVEASRPEYPVDLQWTPTKTPDPLWKYGDGATHSKWQQHSLITIDPHEPGRASTLNYKLMISSAVPRPIALVSTVSAEGVQNVAPFSYFQNVTADPPIYSVCFAGEEANDSLRNVMDTKEACISIVSDWFVEAANATSINTPRHISEWQLSGLHPQSSDMVKPPYAAESAFSVELKYYSHQTIIGKAGVRSATLVLLEAVRFHVREDALGKDKATVDIAKLRPVWRGGGITYGTCAHGFELPRPEAFRVVRETAEVKKLMGEDEQGRNSIED